MSNKKLKETEYSVTKDEMPEVMPELEPNLQDDDRVSITNENEINETLKISINHIINALGIQYINKSDEEKSTIKSIIKQMMNLLKSKGLSNVVLTEDDEDTSEIDSLYSSADDRSIEYGIKSEDFDKLMEDLKESGSPTIKVNENVNPRIKKSDLINYIKTKKNVK